jgi:hypothetical protein
VRSARSSPTSSSTRSAIRRGDRRRDPSGGPRPRLRPIRAAGGCRGKRPGADDRPRPRSGSWRHDRGGERRDRRARDLGPSAPPSPGLAAGSQRAAGRRPGCRRHSTTFR